MLVDALQRLGMTILGMTDSDTGRSGRVLLGVTVLGDDTILSRYKPAEILLVNGIGGVHGVALRRQVFERCKQAGHDFVTIVHPAAVLGGDIVLEEGAQVMAGVIVQAGSRVGRNAIINTHASVDHDCLVGEHVHIAPGATLSGGVTVGDGSHIGTSASVIQNVRIGSGCLVAAGAVVIRDVRDGARVAGIPAREMSR